MADAQRFDVNQAPRTFVHGMMRMTEVKAERDRLSIGW